MSSILRDVLNTLKQRSAAPGAVLEQNEALAHLDSRLSRLAPANGAARCAVSIRPNDCAIWEGILGGGSGPTFKSCKALIGSIAKEGGNLVPVVVRPLPSGSQNSFELLIGNKRRYAIEWLNRNGRPEIRLNALVVDLNDEEAFRLADIENQDRPDISELDRARNYRRALDCFYDGVQSRMAAALRLSNSQLSRMLALAELPDEIVAAFASSDELRVRHSEILAPLLRRAERETMLDEARLICEQQERLCMTGEKMIPAATVLARLKNAVTGENTQAARVAGDDQCGTIERVPGGLAVKMVVPDFANLDEVMADVKEALADSRLVARDKNAWRSS